MSNHEDWDIKSSLDSDADAESEACVSRALTVLREHFEVAAIVVRDIDSKAVTIGGFGDVAERTRLLMNAHRM